MQEMQDEIKTVTEFGAGGDKWVVSTSRVYSCATYLGDNPHLPHLKHEDKKQYLYITIF